MTLSKPKPTGNEVIDKWHLECWEAENAFQDATEVYDKCPSDAPRNKRKKALEALQSTARRLEKVYNNLPCSDPPDKTTIPELFQSIGKVTLEQAARCINKYLETDVRWKVTDYSERLDYHEWNVDLLYGEKGGLSVIVGKVHISQVDDPQDKQPDRKALRLGYSAPADNQHDLMPSRLADLWRGCCYACADLADKINDARLSKGTETDTDSAFLGVS